MQVRTVAAAAPAPAAVPLSKPLPRPVPVERPVQPPVEQTPRKSIETVESQALAEPESAVIVAAAISTALPTELVAAAAAAVPESVPTYRTTAPPSATLNYTLRYGNVSGNGSMTWQHSAAGYSMKLDGKVLGFNILTWASEGAIDAHGLAPTRFTDQRRNKAPIAANFQRGAGKITYSGNPTEYPLLKGSQDRLSWMMQVAAIGEAEPKRLVPGQKLSMFVSGARGDADVWTFQVLGMNDVPVGESQVKAIKLLREPRKQHDTKVEVWLAPSMHHMPVRARLSSDGSTLELLLQGTSPP